ncbi:NAD-dependent succinate-semialdehyde dehydrogenase [Dongshaea marina]|uniref:NAD-dependent succinate-semialdehyde dehydrogenase n=1 Tax=Dongshaea marina TaxID=2047966 RepID=UPI000D3E3CA7|nr:NAD-dependent succinate-semialdehyde dehydrogenase [Dongshaea marina]
MDSQLSPGARQLICRSHYIDGRWLDSPDTLTIYNPATGAPLASIAAAGAREAELAITAAHRSLSAWQRMTMYQRGTRLRDWAEEIKSHREALAELMVFEQGKPLNEALGEVDYGLSYLEWFIEEGKRSYGRLIPSADPHQQLQVISQGIGVCAAITPWNFPMAMIVRKAAPALIAGCSLVVKPSEETPLTALALARLAEQAKLPAGLLNILCGDPVSIGETLTTDPRVRKLSFTGSTRVGKLLAAQSAPSLKRLSLELGGNAPFIVFEDADLSAALQGLMVSKFRNSGQTCVCANRIYLQRSIASEFIKQLEEKLGSLTPGFGMKTESNQGPLINQAAIDKVEQLIEDALTKGARCLTGGHRLEGSGNFFEPTVLLDIDESMDICHQEIFGPVVAIQQFDDEAEVIRRANDTPYGLASYCFTQNLARAKRLSLQLESGIVSINSGLFSAAQAPFGGLKESGYGKEGGTEGLNDYLDHKYIALHD